MPTHSNQLSLFCLVLGLQKCYITEEAARATCPSEKDIREKRYKEYTLFRKFDGSIELSFVKLLSHPEAVVSALETFQFVRGFHAKILQTVANRIM